MWGWFTLLETAKHNGIKNPTEWLTKVGNAFYHHCMDRTLTYEIEMDRYGKQVRQIDRQAIKTFDVTSWLPRNYAATEKDEA